MRVAIMGNVGSQVQLRPEGGRGDSKQDERDLPDLSKFTGKALSLSLIDPTEGEKVLVNAEIRSCTRAGSIYRLYLLVTRKKGKVSERTLRVAYWRGCDRILSIVVRQEGKNIKCVVAQIEKPTS